MGSQSECHSYEEFSQIVKNPLVYNKIFICIYCFLLERIFFRSKAIHSYSKKFILSGGSVFKIIFDLFRFYKKCVIWPKKPENFALTRYYHSTKLVLGTFLSLFFSGNRSSRPKVISPEVRSPGTRAMLPEINSHAFNPKSCCSKFYRVFNHEEK